MYYGVETTHVTSKQQTLAASTLDIAPNPGFVISELTISISGLLSATPNSSLPFADVALLGTSDPAGRIVMRSVPFNTLADGWPAAVAFTGSFTNQATEAFPLRINFYLAA